ncbi:unnamed protein product [Pleuronectes platessa]|uniref:Uncharacterized protein n=1 Tax=Pleuronectes platessa TaxID=8262 RepID=A0A9N7VIU5_PLEPL|nr:unnamed protein product [Pleuronectes platessa]
MGAGTRKKSNDDDDHTASDDPRVPCWLPVSGNKEPDLEMGQKWRKSKVSSSCWSSFPKRNRGTSLEMSGVKGKWPTCESH